MPRPMGTYKADTAAQWGAKCVKLGDELAAAQREIARLTLALDNARAALETDAELLECLRDDLKPGAIAHMKQAANAAREALGK